ncbi:MAG: 50S ribosomal protein L3 [Spirochaetes bacterium]|nr:50S ribosomal protein L3 [Spirochaetota bacterium]
MKVLATKIGMTSVFTEKGLRVPVTLLQVGPSKVLDLKTPEKGGYHAVVLGFGARKAKKVTKAQAGNYKKIGTEPVRIMREARSEEAPAVTVGQALDVSLFEGVKFVDVTGVTIGKGFQGVVKKYRFRGGPGGHGSNFHRRLGSAGANTDPARVWKGKKMPGRMGGENRTILSLEVVKADKENNLLLVKGSVPGSRNTLVWVRKAVKRT